MDIPPGQAKDLPLAVDRGEAMKREFDLAGGDRRTEQVMAGPPVPRLAKSGWLIK